MRIRQADAETVLFKAADLALKTRENEWDERVTALSDTCSSSSRTHVVFLGTAMLAKAIDLRHSAFAIKARGPVAGAYSARTLCHSVWVPNAAKLGVDLGRSGREPLNNQPYFRHERVSPDMIVRDVNALHELIAILKKLDRLESPREAMKALASFIRVRRRYRTEYPVYSVESLELTLTSFVGRATEFVGADSEGGKRAQAVAAGVLTVFAGGERVRSDRVNDPDRHLPGDIGVLAPDGSRWQEVFEVRDKPVQPHDIDVYVEKVATAKIDRAGLIAVAEEQSMIDITDQNETAERLGVVLRLFFGWESFIRDVLFWSPGGEGYLVREAHQHVYHHLIKLEASEEAVEAWLALGEST